MTPLSQQLTQRRFSISLGASVCSENQRTKNTTCFLTDEWNCQHSSTDASNLRCRFVVLVCSDICRWSINIFSLTSKLLLYLNWFSLCGSCYINGSIRASMAYKLSLETLDTIRNEKNAYRYQIYGLAIFQDQPTYLLLRYHQSQCCLTSRLKMNVHPYKWISQMHY